MALQPGLSAQQIITLATQIAKGASGMTAQAGQFLNLVLQELAQGYNIVGDQGWFTITFQVSPLTGQVNSANVVNGSGPYALPDDFLSMDRNDFFWQLGGINYFPTAMPIAEFDALVQQPGFSSYPSCYAVDTSTDPWGLYIWPASSGAYQAFGRYRKQTTDLTSPQTSSSVPWFPNQTYLVTRIAAEMMAITGDNRREQFLRESENILRRYLDLEGNSATFAARVMLDNRRFGRRWLDQRATKNIPW